MMVAMAYELRDLADRFWATARWPSRDAGDDRARWPAWLGSSWADASDGRQSAKPAGACSGPLRRAAGRDERNDQGERHQQVQHYGEEKDVPQAGRGAVFRVAVHGGPLSDGTHRK